MKQGVSGARPADQALAVPVEPVSRLDPAGVDPSRTEQRLRDKMRFILGVRGKPTAFAHAHGLCDETVLAFLRGSRPPEPKLLEAIGYRREYRYAPCPCFRCTKARTDFDPGAIHFGVSVEMQGMFLCETCGNKRCPHAADHKLECTGSNEPGQPGSLYPAIAMETGTAIDSEAGVVAKP